MPSGDLSRIRYVAQAEAVTKPFTRAGPLPVRGRGGSCDDEVKDQLSLAHSLFSSPLCMPEAALTMLCVLIYVRSRVFLAVGLHSSWTAPNWAPTSIRRARVLKQSTPWQPCCAGALLLQFARHTQHASAARRQRRRRWPNRARASRGAPSPTTRLMIGAGPPPAVLELISIEKCINVSTGTVGVMRAGTVCRVRAVQKSFVGQRTRPRASSS